MIRLRFGLALALALAAPAAAHGADGKWSCKLADRDLGELNLTGEHYVLAGGTAGEGDLRTLSDGVTSAILGGPLSLVIGATQLLANPDGTLALQVTGMFPTRTLGSCTPL